MKAQFEQQSLAEAQEAQQFHRRPYVQISYGTLKMILHTPSALI